MCENKTTSVEPDFLVRILESLVNARASEIKATQWPKMMELLAELKSHSLWNYTHSLRVGFYASALAQHEGSDPLLALYGGAGHDLGKTRVSLAVLDADEFGEVEREAIKKHPRDGFEILDEHFPLAALVAGIHHNFQENAYGIDIDEESKAPLWGGVRELVMGTGQRVAACDFFDAWTTRAKRDGDVGDVETAMERHGISAQRISWLVANDLVRIRPGA